ncbi:MAG: isochorismatase family protein, partial [Microbacteriaceae bacterium]|nr:isochorismatase family protein [Burkholderiaceae bacterium]
HEADAVLARIRTLATQARAAGMPVVWVQHERAKHTLVHGSDGWALPAVVQAEPGDHFVRKTTPDAFLRTGLADWLAARDIRHLVVCGYATEFCIDTSTRRAAGLGLGVTLVADGHTTHDKPHASGAMIRAHHNATLPGLTSFGPLIRAVAAADIDFGTETTSALAPGQLHSAEQLAALYGQPSEASLVKESAVLNAAYRALLKASPFVVLAAIGPGGLDASPRGDPAPVLVVQDERTLLLPDRRGNQRLDSLRNIVADPRVALLCLVPGTPETLRINGRAHVSADPALCQRLAIDGKPPATVVVIDIDVVYFQCARALARSQLWNPASWPARNTLPSAGHMLTTASQGRFDGAAYDAALPLRQRDTLY